MGVLSALPIISGRQRLLLPVGGRAAASSPPICCSRTRPTPITPADGALVGLLAGLVGAVVHLVVSIPIDLLVGPMRARDDAAHRRECGTCRRKCATWSTRQPAQARSPALCVSAHHRLRVHGCFVGAIFSTHRRPARRADLQEADAARRRRHHRRCASVRCTAAAHACILRSALRTSIGSPA